MRSDRRVRRDEVWFEITQYLDPRSGHLATEIGELSIPHVEGADHRVGVGAPSTQRRARSLEQRRPLPQHPVVVRAGGGETGTALRDELRYFGLDRAASFAESRAVMMSFSVSAVRRFRQLFRSSFAVVRVCWRWISTPRPEASTR